MDFRLISEFQTFGFGFWLFDRIFLVPRLDIWNCSSANQALTSNCWILHWSWYPYKIPSSKVYQHCNLDSWKRNNFAWVSLKSLCYVYSEFFPNNAEPPFWRNGRVSRWDRGVLMILARLRLSCNAKWLFSEWWLCSARWDGRDRRVQMSLSRLCL